MLKFLTHKLRTHSLNEDHDQDKTDDDHDSGTESDDEHGEADDPESTAMESEAERSSAATLTPCSPYFLDSALPSDDHHSSEEELEVINAADKGKGGAAALSAPASGVNGPGGGGCVAAPEKRKWSQVAALLAVEAASSSDDEVQGLLAAMATPVRFRTWPPLDAHKPGRSLSPPPKLFHYAGTAAAGGDASPRKRHRHTPRASHIQRPCLDFEKMQQLKARAVTAWRHGGDHGGELSVFCW